MSKHLFLTLCYIGPPGAGKSTTAALLGRDHGYVYYEGYSLLNCCNPYIDPKAKEPTVALSNQRPLKVRDNKHSSKTFFL